ncbi:MAG: hypothetical protein R6U87_08360, partial [Thiohalospira sp.]
MRTALWTIAGLALLVWPLGLGWVVITEQQDAALVSPVQQLRSSSARLGENGLRLARGEADALGAMAAEQRDFQRALRRLETNLAQSGPLVRPEALESAARAVADQWRTARETLAAIDADALARAAEAAATVEAAAAELAEVGGELAALTVEQGGQS